MRKKFYKAVAIMIAVNMMSFTVFAAETGEPEIPAGDPPVAETPVSDDTPASEPEQNNNPEPESTPSTDSPSDTDSNLPADSEPASDTTATSEPAPASNPEPSTDIPASTEQTTTTDTAASTGQTTTDTPASTEQTTTTDAPTSTEQTTTTDTPASTGQTTTTDAPASTSQTTTTDTPSSTDQTTTANTTPSTGTTSETGQSASQQTDQQNSNTQETNQNDAKNGDNKEQTQTTSSTDGTTGSADTNAANNSGTGNGGENGNESTTTVNMLLDGDTNSDSDQLTEEMLNGSLRRVAENQDTTFFSDDSGLENESSQEESSWSMDGNIENVMGVRAGVDGDNVVIEYKTKHTDDWDYSYGNNPLTISYTGADGKEVTQTISFEWNGSGIHGDNWSNIDGAVLSKYSDQADTEILRMSIPASYFGSTDFTISGGKYSTTVNSSGIQSSAPNSSVYTGISMDGTFNDWNAVQKTELNEPEGQHNVESVAMQIEQDYVYIYIKDDGSNSATWAGPNSNGKYAITTDLGRTLVFQLTEDGAVVGADGAISNHQGSQWEIAIPTSSLPQNNGTLSFGLYLTEPTITGSGNIGNTSSSVGIDYDGLYGDWNDVRHTEIQYSTAGTHENVPDGEAAMYFDQNNGNIYGHCETRMQAHLDEQGGEYTQAVSVIVNDDWSKALQMRLATVDSVGNINWNPEKTNLQDGSYEYYIFGIDSWGSSQNISNLYDADVCYGKATITITEGRHDMEWYVDSRSLAARYGISENDVKTVSSQYGRIGQQLVTSAGASSGPWGGAVMCVLSALVPFVIKKKFTF